MWNCIRQVTVPRAKCNDLLAAEKNKVVTYIGFEYQAEQLFDPIRDTVTVRIFERAKD